MLNRPIFHFKTEKYYPFNLLQKSTYFSRMKTKLTLLFIMLLIFASACKKKKDEVNSQKPSYVSYTKNGQKITLNYPQWISIWSEPCSWTYVNFETSSQLGFSLSDTAGPGIFPIIRNQDNYARVISMEPNSEFYLLEEGSVMISKCDTINCIVEGTFEGKFVNVNLTDSFDISDGEFYFKKKY